MPLIEVHLLEGRTEEQKKALCTAITKAVQESIGAPVETIRVWIEEFTPQGLHGRRRLVRRRRSIEPRSSSADRAPRACRSKSAFFVSYVLEERLELLQERHPRPCRSWWTAFDSSTILALALARAASTMLAVHRVSSASAASIAFSSPAIRVSSGFSVRRLLGDELGPDLPQLLRGLGGSGGRDRRPGRGRFVLLRPGADSPRPASPPAPGNGS